MDIDSVRLIQWLRGIAANPNDQPQRRNRALYIAASFNVHRNPTRLMAQIAEFTTGDIDIFHCFRIRGTTETAPKPVDLHADRLQSVTSEFGVFPNVADLEGHVIELISTLPEGIESLLDTDKKLEFHSHLLHLETEANESLDEYTNKYGYHYIFRAGLRNYYMTRAVVKYVNFWRPDPRGAGYRDFAQRLCYEAIEQYPPLNSAEKRIIILAIRCFPEDAFRFWDWISEYRVAYYAMKACIDILEENSCEHHLNKLMESLELKHCEGRRTSSIPFAIACHQIYQTLILQRSESRSELTRMTLAKWSRQGFLKIRLMNWTTQFLEEAQYLCTVSCIKPSNYQTSSN